MSVPVAVPVGLSDCTRFMVSSNAPGPVTPTTLVEKKGAERSHG
jgi:hypothetical protein